MTTQSRLSSAFDRVVTAINAVDAKTGGGGRNSYCRDNSGRMYCYADARWVTESDDNFGVSYYQFNESAGIGADPIVEWEHMGIPVRPGATIKNLLIAGKTNSTEVSDIEIYATLRKPSPITRWETGLDSDGEDVETVLVRDFFAASTSGLHILSGNSNDLRRQEWALDEEVTELSMLSIYMKPVGTNTQNRYFRMIYSWEIDL